MTLLTRRERQVLELLAAGHGNRRMADMLGISEPTIAMHLLNARNRLGAKTREHAVALAVARAEIVVVT